METTQLLHFPSIQAAEAHARIADSGKVRVGDEIAPMRSEGPSVYQAGNFPDLEKVDMLALRREVMRLRRELELVSSEISREHERVSAEISREHERVLSEAFRQVEELKVALTAERSRTERAKAALVAVVRSRSWRATAPFRSLRNALRKAKGKRPGLVIEAELAALHETAS